MGVNDIIITSKKEMESFLARGHGIIGIVDSDPIKKEWVKNQCMSEDLLNVLH